MHSIDKGQVLWELILTSLTDQVYPPTKSTVPSQGHGPQLCSQEVLNLNLSLSTLIRRCGANCPISLHPSFSIYRQSIAEEVL